jgi:hypothetical protein
VRRSLLLRRRSASSRIRYLGVKAFFSDTFC